MAEQATQVNSADGIGFEGMPNKKEAWNDPRDLGTVAATHLDDTVQQVTERLHHD